jgi:hypothetical protein
MKSGQSRGKGKVRKYDEMDNIPEDDGEHEVKINEGP